MRDLYAWARLASSFLPPPPETFCSRTAMKRVGDVGKLWKRRGLLAVVSRVLTTPTFALGLMAMAVAFYSLLFGLSWET